MEGDLPLKGSETLKMQGAMLHIQITNALPYNNNNNRSTATIIDKCYHCHHSNIGRYSS